MILPNKYISMSESLMGLSAMLLDILKDRGMQIEELWSEFKNYYTNNKIIKRVPTYNKFALAVNFMFLTNMVNYSEKGVIFNENSKFKNI